MLQAVPSNTPYAAQGRPYSLGLSTLILSAISLAYKEPKKEPETMTSIADICDSCLTPSEVTKHFRRARLNLCTCCDGWTRMSLRRTRKIPSWVRPDSRLSPEEIEEMKQQFNQMQDNHNFGGFHGRRMVLEMGFPYFGPLNNRAWGHALSALNLEELDPSIHPPNLHHTVIDEELSKMENAGVMCLPSNNRMREHLAHISRGDFGPENKGRLVTALFMWLVSEDEFIARNSEAWATSFQFLREIVDELGERANFVDDTIRVTGSSGNIYRIQPRLHPPYFIVYREIEDRKEPICIDPIGAHTVVFGDVLVNLVLSLYDDTMSARHINTLQRHVFGPPEHLRTRRVNRNIDHLWRRALGDMPGGEEDPQALFQQWRLLIDRFQTNLADWTPDPEDDDT